MSQKEASLISISSQTLYFPPPFSRAISNVLSLKNNSNDLVAFKVKTTTPKRYCVKPRWGIINPESSIEITITMHATKESIGISDLQDKFLVESARIKPEEQNIPHQDLWKTTLNKDRIFKNKLKCKFDPKVPENLKIVLLNDNSVLIHSKNDIRGKESFSSAGVPDVGEEGEDETMESDQHAIAGVEKEGTVYPNMAIQQQPFAPVAQEPKLPQSELLQQASEIEMIPPNIDQQFAAPVPTPNIPAQMTVDQIPASIFPQEQQQLQPQLQPQPEIQSQQETQPQSQPQSQPEIQPLQCQPETITQQEFQESTIPKQEGEGSSIEREEREREGYSSAIAQPQSQVQQQPTTVPTCITEENIPRRSEPKVKSEDILVERSKYESLRRKFEKLSEDFQTKTQEYLQMEREIKVIRSENEELKKRIKNEPKLREGLRQRREAKTQETTETQTPVVKEQPTAIDKRYSIIMILIVAIVFFLIGKLL